MNSGELEDLLEKNEIVAQIFGEFKQIASVLRSGNTCNIVLHLLLHLKSNISQDPFLVQTE